MTDFSLCDIGNLEIHAIAIREQLVKLVFGWAISAHSNVGLECPTSTESHQTDAKKSRQLKGDGCRLRHELDCADIAC